VGPVRRQAASHCGADRRRASDRRGQTVRELALRPMAELVLLLRGQRANHRRGADEQLTGVCYSGSDVGGQTAIQCLVRRLVRTRLLRIDPVRGKPRPSGRGRIARTP